MNELARRHFMQGLCAVASLGPLAGCASMKDERFFENAKLPIGIQLYTLGELITKDLDGALAEVARIGYSTVETAGYAGQTPATLRAAFDRAGLSCTSAHVGIRTGTTAEPGLLGDLDKLVADIHVLGASHVVAPLFDAPADLRLEPRPDEGVRHMARIAAAMTESHWKQLAARLNGFGAVMKRNGLGFGYHNHNIEFVPVGTSTGFDILLAETDPALVTFELDIGWTAAAGLDPVAVFAKDPGRYTLAHLKDIQATTVANLDFRMDPTEVGSGRLDWHRILSAARAAGVRKFFVEQEAPFQFPRLEAAARSHAFLSALEA
ncbi:MAG: sugar phosphate isomerase/epimerase [Alphaproteobacteria bacterium]|nr:sugar phosphate isomerase/epimerase [Alphaproteobacteria bacterium]